MKKVTRWFLVFIGIILVVFTATIVIRWKSLPWSPGYIPGTVYVPPVGDTHPTATFFSPSAVTPTSEFDLVWIDPALPEQLQSQFVQTDSIQQAGQIGEADAVLSISDQSSILSWTYALVAPFPTIADGFSSSELKSAWEGGINPLSAGQSLLLSDESLAVLSAWWGEPAGGAVKVIPADELLDYAWSQRPSLAMIPFERLTPEWKVLKIDGISPIDHNFRQNDYYLSVPVSASGPAAELFRDLKGNRDPDKFTSVVLTGVTALVRATAWTMENEGINYPALDIKDWLVTADILHVSNEVPFMVGCAYPNPSQAGLRFCSDPRYIQLMESIGTDVVELTGDHFGDYGPEAMLYTLNLYQDRDWPYYGGGATRQDAQEPVLFEHNGNKIAFLGCNAKGGGYATAGAQYPGAVACDFELMTGQIKDLREQGYLPIATFQHFEYYTYLAQPDQIRDALTLTRAGAVIVSGSQAHQPQGFEIGNGAFVHHGLGNLFFDQIYEFPPHTATAFIDRHIIFDGKHISTELLTIKFLDFARARPMTVLERKELLKLVFNASGW